MKRIICLLTILCMLTALVCGCGVVTDEASGVSSEVDLSSVIVSDDVSDNESSQDISAEASEDETVSERNLEASIEEHREETQAEMFERIVASDNFVPTSNLADISGIHLETIYSDMFCQHCGNCNDVFKSVPTIKTEYTSILDQEKDESAPQKKSFKILDKEYNLTYSHSYQAEMLGYMHVYENDERLGYVTVDSETDKITSLTYYPDTEEFPDTEEEAVSIIKRLVEEMGHNINFDELDYTCTTSVEKKYSNGTYRNLKDGFAALEENEVLDYYKFVYRKIPHGVYTNESIEVKFEPKSERQNEETITIHISDYDDEALNDMVEKALPYVDKIESIVLNNLMEYQNENYEVLGITKDNSIHVEMRDCVLYIISDHSIAIKRTEYSRIDKYYKGEVASVVTLTKIE